MAGQLKILLILCLCVWLFDDGYLQLFCVYQSFLFTFRAVKRIVFQNCILSKSITSFTATNRTYNPLRFIHFIHSSDFLKEAIHSSIAPASIYCCCKTAIPVVGMSSSLFSKRYFLPDMFLKLPYCFQYYPDILVVFLLAYCPNLR